MSNKQTEREAFHAGYQAGYENGKRDAVKHGYWIPLNHMYHVLAHDDSFWRCSECLKASIRITDYCPFCGACMDRKEKENG